MNRFSPGIPPPQQITLTIVLWDLEEITLRTDLFQVTGDSAVTGIFPLEIDGVDVAYIEAHLDESYKETVIYSTITIE